MRVNLTASDVSDSGLAFMGVALQIYQGQASN
jgi:hypothetical protein